MRGFGVVDPAAPVNRAHPLNRGLVSWWLALPSQARGIYWRDLIGRNHGTLTSMDPATDHIGPKGRPGGYGALDFDGSNDYVTIPHSDALNPPSQITVAAWCRLTDASFLRPVVEMRNATTAEYWFMLSLGNGSMDTGVQTSAGYKEVTAAFPTNVWVFLVMSADGTNVTQYQNGRVAGTPIAYNGTLVQNAASVLDIGAHQPRNRWWKGQLDDVRVWDRGLSASEVRALYRESLAGYPGTLNWMRAPRRWPEQSTTVTYTYAGAGGATSAGAASISRTLVPSVSGGALAAGAATVSRTLDYTPVGGGVTAGSATIAATVVYVPSGGAVSGGVASISRTLIPPVPTGGGVSAGAATISRTLDYSPAGGAVSSGTATVTFEGQAAVWEYLATGGAIAAGVAAISRTLAYLVSGGATAAGAATASIVYPLDLYSDGHTALGQAGTLDLYADGHTPLGPPGG